MTWEIRFACTLAAGLSFVAGCSLTLANPTFGNRDAGTDAGADSGGPEQDAGSDGGTDGGTDAGEPPCECWSCEVTPCLQAVEISAGGTHTCALASNERVYCWGSNEDGQLGRGDVGGSSALPGVVVGLGGAGTLERVRSIRAGANYSCALLNDGSIACWGGNEYGQLGNGSFGTTDQPIPALVHGSSSGSPLAGADQITTGGTHACARTGFTAVCWGFNTNGQIGANLSASTRNVTFATPVLAETGTASLTPIVEISAGDRHTCALAGMDAYCWGSGLAGRLGNGGTSGSTRPVRVLGLGGTGPLNDATQIASGNTHSCASTSSAVLCWGSNYSGQLGTGASGAGMDQVFPVRVLGPDAPTYLDAANELGLGNGTSCARLADQLLCWGDNEQGQLGNGGSGFGSVGVHADPVLSVDGTMPLAVSHFSAGPSHACAIDGNGAPHCWGRNLNGQLGDGSMNMRTLPRRVSAP